MKNKFINVPTNKYYAGIGSRNITQNESLFLVKVAFFMTLSGYKLTSGSSNGADTAFEFGAKTAYNYLTKKFNLPQDDYDRVMRCFIPWNKYNGRITQSGYAIGGDNQAKQYTSLFHPNWSNLSTGVKTLMARNANQILLDNLDQPVKLVICTTPDGAYDKTSTTCKTGGTGQAIRIANSNNINVFNVNYPPHKERIVCWLNTMNKEYIDDFSFNADSFIEQAYNEYTGFKQVIVGDLVSMAERGQVDVMVQGLSCQCTHGKGLAKQVFNTFPEVLLADQATRKGDRGKLGTYQAVPVERQGKRFVIINAYTQFNYSNNHNVLNVDYKAVTAIFKAITKEFKGKQLHLPKIGAGLGSGCWLTLSQIINLELKDMKYPILVNI